MHAFFLAHREEDVRMLALKYKQQEGMDMQFMLQQIDGWQRARTKLPMWAEHDGIVFPPHISMEQCSSEVTARYKAGLIAGIASSTPTPANTTLIDLTGGFGVDFSYMSQQVSKAIYVEQQEHLCQIAEHNFGKLGLTNTTVRHSHAEDILDKMGSFENKNPDSTVIFLDPARRDTHGKKTYAISDCTPDVVTLLPKLKAVASTIVIKLSPMLDHHEAMRLLPGVTEVHIVSVKNECKELLLVIAPPVLPEGAPPCLPKGEVKLICVNDHEVFRTTINCSQRKETTENLLVETIKSSSPTGRLGGALGGALLVPNASIMKAGCFGALCQRFNVATLDSNSHLFIAKNTDSIADFPGKTFVIHATCSMNKRELKKTLSGISQANIATRNFPFSAAELRKRLKLKDGGEWYIFGTTLGKEHLLLVCKKS